MSAEDGNWTDADGVSLDPIERDEDCVVYEPPPRSTKDQAAKLWHRESPVISFANETHLTARQLGALRRLRQHYWRLGRLPADDEKLRRCSTLTADEWTEVRDILAEEFESDRRDSDLEASRQAAIKAYADQVEGARERQARHRAKLRQAAT